ncbi:MAG TPA: ERF family protein [Magnetospirillum sp.]|nr:ERF family protein [Magnetospirillum sp.]
MRTSDALDQLATALAKAQGEMKNATLNKQNPHFKSRYADLAEIRNAVTPALAKHGIAVVQGTDTEENTIVVFTRLIHASGQWIESRFPIPYDKPQTMGSGITYGRRYTLSAVTNIAADEDDDGNQANEKAAEPKTSYARSGIVRAEFERLQKGIHDIEASGTVEDLALFWKNNAKTIAALPADWREEIEAIKEDAKDALKAKVAA